MLKSKTPSPSLVVACLALAIALGGTAYAASLPTNSVGSPQVKPNSLKGIDIKESTLAGVLLGKGNAQARARILPPTTGFTTLLAIPKSTSRSTAAVERADALRQHDEFRRIHVGASRGSWLARSRPWTPESGRRSRLRGRDRAFLRRTG